jgi:hypothetical protein
MMICPESRTHVALLCATEGPESAMLASCLPERPLRSRVSTSYRGIAVERKRLKFHSADMEVAMREGDEPSRPAYRSCRWISTIFLNGLTTLARMTSCCEDVLRGISCTDAILLQGTTQQFCPPTPPANLSLRLSSFSGLPSLLLYLLSVIVVQAQRIWHNDSNSSLPPQL